MTAYVKDPQALLDYAVDWSPWLGAGETISTAVVTVDAGLTKDRPETAASSGLVTVWISGGSDGDTYSVNFHITTSQGRTDERSIHIRVRNR